MTMNRKIYRRPSVRVRAMVLESMVAASDPTTVTGSAVYEEVTDGYAASKPHFKSVWDEEEGLPATSR